MTFVHRIIRILMVAIVLVIGFGAIATVFGDVWEYVEIKIEVVRLAVILSGIALSCLGLLFIVTGITKRRSGKFLSFDNEGGTVSISTDAIADYVAKLSSEFPSIVRMKPQVIPGRNSIDIVVKVRIKAGPQINEVCELLQQRIKESVGNGLGISQVRRVEVSVGDIVSEHVRD
jgi:uncharacterized alkaline shock family protein YloU